MAKRNERGVQKRTKAFTHARTNAIKANSGKKGSAMSHSKASTNPHRVDPSGGKKGSQFRTRATINRLNMYNEKPDMAKMKARPTDPTVGRIEPDRKWFGNVRTADQKELDKYRKAL